MTRPTLIVQTVCFHASDRAAAGRLGADLYDRVTRPPEDPLAHGPGIPVSSAVAPDRVDLEAADTLVLVPVLGKLTFMKRREDVLRRLSDWHAKLGPGHVLPVPTDEGWRSVEDELPGKYLQTELESSSSPRRLTIDEIVIGTSRLLGAERLRLFVSHAKADLASTQEAAKKIHHYVRTDTTASAFFDAVDLPPGESLEKNLDAALDAGVFVAVRGDAYSSRSWCQKEMLLAKKNGLPGLTVEVLREGEPRSGAYSGNSPSVVWDGEPAEVVSRALVEWLRTAVFRREAKRLVESLDLRDEVAILGRAPELLDIAQGPLDPSVAQVAVHPDPELPVVEREVLQLAHPRLSLVTPTTAYRRVAGAGSTGVENPLDGMQVALSLSESPDVDGPDGFTEEHVVDATVFLARSLVSAGAAIAYGGDLRRNGYTELLADLISAYNQTAAEKGELLHSYLGAPLRLEDARGGLSITAHDLGDEEDPMTAEALLAPPGADVTPPPHESALYFSDMRRVMAARTAARVVLGGAAKPRLEDGGTGYGGRFPGVVEEAWRTLEAGKPLYVAGGYGGGAELVAALLRGEPTPERLQDATWMEYPTFRERAEAIDAHAWRAELGLPSTMDELADAVREFGRERLASDEASRRWNGLTVAENRELFATRDPVRLATLVLAGLVEFARAAAGEKLQIEIVQGDIVQARDLDAVAVATFDDVPLSGASGALDRKLGGRASLARGAGQSLVSAEASAVGTDWLHLASLGALDDLDGLPQRIAEASRGSAELARRHGFARLGVVAFGGTVVEDVRDVARAMLSGLREGLPAGGSEDPSRSRGSGFRGLTVVWFEKEPSRFVAVEEELKKADDVHVTTQRPSAVSERPPARPGAELILTVRLEGDELSVTVLPPAGTGIARTHRTPLEPEQLDEFATGYGGGRATPDHPVLASRGQELATLLLGANAPDLLAHCREAKVVVIHDVPSSRLPFELLLAEPTGEEPVRPATAGGVNRRLAVAGAMLQHLLAPPPRAGKLRVLLVVNPTEDLPGTEREGEAVQRALEDQAQVELTTLRGDEATREAVLEALGRTDVLHYSGHAFFNGPGEDQNGLKLADGSFTLAELSGRTLPVRLAFVNACEAGRVRGAVETEAAAFAELFLRGGIEAYLGTYWEVGDASAASFAARVYAVLSSGGTLDEAVRAGRAELLASEERDWANYLLYGDGRFRLVSKKA